MSLLALPIDAARAEILRRFAEQRLLILVAEPGAGKTTRLPPMLLEALPAGEIVVLEPRRIAARLAARRVARELGEELGRTVGYQIRHERVGGETTRIRFVTEAVLARRWLDDPKLSGVAAVVLDEFHERHIHSDLALAIALALRRGERPDLGLVVMSATLDAAALAAHTGGAVVSVPGRCHPVAIEHRVDRHRRPLEGQVAAALRDLVDDGLDGDVLVFLPGAGEIRRAAAALADLARQDDLDVMPLHGEMAIDEQERSIRPGPKRKVVLATNVAETSLTVEGVVAVIDSGLARRPASASWSGIRRLETIPIGKSSAEQRAGRAGRVRPGRALRLYGPEQLASRSAAERPEILRSDLADLCLLLRCAGISDEAKLPWLDAPPAANFSSARDLLRALGAIDDRGAPTAIGRRMAGLPVGVRAARLAVEAAARGAAKTGALAAALLEAGSDRAEANRAGASSDLLEAVENASRRPPPESVRRTAADIERRLEASGRRQPDALLVAALAAFPDRVGQRLAPRGHDYALADGGHARLADTSVVRDAEWLVALDGDEAPRGGLVIRWASAIEPEWLLELAPEAIESTKRVEFEPRRQRLETVSRVTYRGLVLEEARTIGASGPEAEALLLREVLAAGVDAIDSAAEMERLRSRLGLLTRIRSGVPTFDETERRELLAELCVGRSSFAELREVGLAAEIRRRVAATLGGGWERDVPETIALPGRARVAVQYDGDSPWIASRLQDYFGLREAPRIAGGRVALVCHLLAPNGRAVQVTTDLAGFWERLYPSVRRELMRRYPRHKWPENPLLRVS